MHSTSSADGDALFLEVLFAVPHQDGPLDEGAQAEVALVWLLTSMRQNVPRQGLLEGE